MSGTAIKTSGVGKSCTSHLNLTVSLADVDRRAKDSLPKIRTQTARLPVQRPPYAGYDPTERQW